MMNWVIVCLVVSGIGIVLAGLIIGSRAQMEDYSYVAYALIGAALIAMAGLLWGIRWFLNTLPPWL